MIGSGRVKVGDHRGRSSAVERPIYIHSTEALLTSNSLLSFQFLSSAYLKDCAMPRLWRVRSRARGHNQGRNLNEASADVEVYPIPQAAIPFNWGDKYLSKTPTTVDSYIAIMEIDLLREFETIMGCHLVPNPFWSTRISLSRNIDAKIQTAQGILRDLDSIH